MDFKNYKIRKVKPKDSKRIWEIRNNPIIRENSNNSEELPWKNHEIWFEKKYFSEENNYCSVLENENNLVIGYCRLDFDDENNHYIISIALDVNFRSKGLGHYFLNEVLQQFDKEKSIFAKIQNGNISSIKLFNKNNFKIYKEDKNNYYLKHYKQKDIN